MHKPIPGKSFIIEPDALTARRMMELRPFIRQSGNQTRPQWHIGKRKLLDYLLVCVEHGTGRFSVGENSFQVGDGSVVWVPPDTVTEMRGNKDMQLMYLHFDLIYDPARSHWNAQIPSGTLDLSDFTDIIHPPIGDPVISQWSGLLDVKEPQKLYPLLRRICLEHCRHTSSELALCGMFLQFLAELCRATEQHDDTASIDSRIRDAATWLRTHNEQPFDLKTVARKANLSSSHFRKLFRETYGISPRDFHQRCRISRAGELLIYLDMTVSETAEILGFGSIYSFSRAFKQVTGISPHQFKTGHPASVMIPE